MTTEESNARGATGRPAAKPPARATYPISGHPRARAVVWGAALLSGGLASIVIFFFAIGVIDLSLHPFLGVVGLVLAAFFGVTIWRFARSERQGNSRWADRERRGF